MKTVKNILIIAVVALFITSCGMSSQCYNVGTGKPMSRTCSGGWTGGQ
jgi:hypothetical protein|tara:strand:+ start:1436 stop:1579 length:144 start_codon:yes stop_codon:yes gene_type:complete